MITISVSIRQHEPILHGLGDYSPNQVASSKVLGAMATKMVATWRVAIPPGFSHKDLEFGFRQERGSPGSLIVPQYESSTITVFVWGRKYQIKGNLRSGGPSSLTSDRRLNERQWSLLCSQLVIVVVNAHSKLLDDFLKLTLHTIKYTKRGGVSRHRSPFATYTTFSTR